MTMGLLSAVCVAPIQAQNQTEEVSSTSAPVAAYGFH